MLWWGIYLIACSVKIGFATIYAPLIITLLVRYISGVPLLEQKYKDNPEFQEYCQETNVFIPWFKSSVNAVKHSQMAEQIDEL